MSKEREVLVVIQTAYGEGTHWFVNMSSFQSWFWKHKGTTVKKIMA